MSQFSLSWDVQKNIYTGLSSLQQNGEFVDMTLAADGHMVKVHQVILALASPYIKQLICSANCPHPIIFLNRVSYKTLCSILEYVYTGEVLVSVENLNELIQAGRELHIKGIDDMSMQHLSTTDSNKNKDQDTEDLCYFQIGSASPHRDTSTTNLYTDQGYLQDAHPSIPDKITTNKEYIESSTDQMLDESMQEETDLIQTGNNTTHYSNVETDDDVPRDKMVQYTVSNQGSVQMILNRFLYYVKHTNRDQVRQWRCVDYVNRGRCPAYVITKGDIVIKRIGAHIHPFHDRRILKKLHAGAVFSAISEAETEGSSKKVKPTGALGDSASEPDDTERPSV